MFLNIFTISVVNTHLCILKRRIISNTLLYMLGPSYKASFSETPVELCALALNTVLNLVEMLSGFMIAWCGKKMWERNYLI